MLLVILDEISRTFVVDLVANIDTRRVLIQSWIPQPWVLAHRHVLLFVNHGGLYSIGESVYAHKPTIILPGFGDQHANGARMQAWNVSILLSRNELTAHVFAHAVQSLMSDPYYQAIVKRLKLLHDLSESEGGGKQRAAQLIDGWLRNGYVHLDTLDHHLPYWIRSQWDIWIFTSFLIYSIWRVTCLCCRNNQRKNEKEKKLWISLLF